MLKYHNGSVKFVGETFECEVARQWSDETIYTVRSLHDGKIVERRVSEYVAEIKVDAPEEIVKEVERIRQADAERIRQKQALIYFRRHFDYRRNINPAGRHQPTDPRHSDLPFV